ncbi:uncharacterized protein LOC128182764 [Crassostrea angulata]|uniref:uncharacterized protein LOC128182764 n=1 Tax=Magallana angulata TaxID=2784310 RepID=UPI0022B0A9B4|nr:uncharacterized protein LOC128182764 [Crassostrea angulata]
MKRERSSERKSKSSSKRQSIDASASHHASECQWYDVLLELHIKSTQQPSFVSFRHAWKEHMNDYYKLASAINKSDDRRELPTVPQPTHTIEWLARTSFKHRPVRLNVPHVQQRQHTVPQQRKHKVARRRCVQHSQLDTSFIVY